ncbi:MAG: acyltransferase [Clostridium sp.]|uniref:acyltransferase n=1 Tax=Clostridium sp. TaxID=1506 RepID=UPI003D6D55A0
MLNKIDASIKGIDKLQIILSIGSKILRGFVVKPFFKNTKGLLFVGKNVSILNKRYLTCGKNVKFENNCEIQGLSTRGLVFENHVTIGHTAMIRPSSYYGVGNIGEGFHIGNNSSIGPLSYIGCAGYIEIGENVMIGPRVSLFAENHNFSNHDTNIKLQGVNRKGIKIEDNCWLGSGVIVLDGVTIGKGSVVTAGTLVTKDVPPGSKVMDKRNKQIVSRY